MTSARRFYISVEVDFFDHEKTNEVGELLAFRHLRAVAWCNRQRTDGFLSRQSALAIVFSEASAKKLVRAGLWEKARGGWRIHDYLKHQRSREQMAAQAEIGRKAAEKRWAERAGAKAEAMP